MKKLTRAKAIEHVETNYSHCLSVPFLEQRKGSIYIINRFNGESFRWHIRYDLESQSKTKIYNTTDLNKAIEENPALLFTKDKQAIQSRIDTMLARMKRCAAYIANNNLNDKRLDKALYWLTECKKEYRKAKADLKAIKL